MVIRDQSSEPTDKAEGPASRSRREFLKIAGIATAGLAFPSVLLAACGDDSAATTVATTVPPATTTTTATTGTTAAATTTTTTQKLLEVRYAYGNPETTLAGFTNQTWPVFAGRRNVNMDASALQPSVVPQALASGRFDIVDFSPVTALNLHIAGGGKPKIIGHSQPVNDYMIVANKDTVPTGEDLEGKVFGISSPASISFYIPRLLFDQVGVDMDTMDVQRIGGTSSRAQALISGAIDAGAVYSDVAFQLVATEENLHILYNAADFVTLVFSSMMANEDFVTDEENRDGIVRMLMSRAELLAFIVTDKDEFGARYVERFGESRIDPAALSNAHAFYLQSGMWDPDLKMNVAGLEETARIAREEVEPPFAQGELPIDEWVDTSFRDEAIERLGGEGWWR